MWPVILEIGPLKLYSFGLMAALAFLAGSQLLRIEFERRKLGVDRWSNYAVGALLGGFVGARVNYLITHLDDLKLDPRGALFSGSGLIWYGGLIGGVLVAYFFSRRYKQHFGEISDAFSPALVAAYILGRVGCLVSGDGDYGGPSDLPWAMAFPNGIVPTTERVHPTPIYEVLLSLPILAFLWRTRHKNWPVWTQFGVYLTLTGIERFVVEYWRLNQPGLLGLTTPQQVSVVLVAIGAALWIRGARAEGTATARRIVPAG